MFGRTPFVCGRPLFVCGIISFLFHIVITVAWLLPTAEKGGYRLANSENLFYNTDIGLRSAAACVLPENGQNA